MPSILNMKKCASIISIIILLLLISSHNLYVEGKIRYHSVRDTHSDDASIDGMDNVKVAKKKEEEEEEETETETEEAVSNNVRIHRVLEPVVERDTLQPSPSPSSNHGPYTYTPYSNNQTGIQSDNDLPRFFKILIACIFIVIVIIFCLDCLFFDHVPNGVGLILNRRGQRAMENIRGQRAMENRRINRRYESEMDSRQINRQYNASATYAYRIHLFTGNNNSREEVSQRDVVATYPSPVLSNNYNVRNNTLPLSLSLDERIELYNKAFNSNGNQLILKSKHIVSKVNANESDIEVCLDIGLDASKDNFSNNKNLIKESDTVEDASATTKMMTNGTCSICIDEFIKNDQIVYSKLCSHVYHKHCMVSYLATNAQQEIHGSPALDITDNPCPSCRQNYCQILDEDLTCQLQHSVQPAAAL